MLGKTGVVGTGTYLAWGMTSALTRHLFKFRPIQMSLVASVSGLGKDEAAASVKIVKVKKVEGFMMAVWLDYEFGVAAC